MKVKHRNCKVLALITCLLFVVSAARGEESESTENGQSGEPSAISTSTVNATNASNDPLTPKYQVQALNYAMPTVEGQGSRWSDEELLRLIVPYRLGDTTNLVRVYTPLWSAPLGTVVVGGDPPSSGRRDRVFGLGDVTIYSLSIKNVFTPVTPSVPA